MEFKNLLKAQTRPSHQRRHLSIQPQLSLWELKCSPSQTLKLQLKINAKLFKHCVVSHASWHYSTAQSSPPWAGLLMDFTILLCSHQLPRRMHWEVTWQRAALAKLWETQRAPTNHVHASQRMTFPDASVFFSTDAFQRVCLCVGMHMLKYVKVGHTCQNKSIFFRGFPRTNNDSCPLHALIQPYVFYHGRNPNGSTRA